MEKPKVAGIVPEIVQLESGNNYAWCSCGKSDRQPFCNGEHKGTKFSPKLFKVEADKKAAMCMCKQTSNPPYCDGSHSKLE